jgi:DNA-binding MarR family transcriptional regulator
MRRNSRLKAPRELAVVLHDLAWLLPRTIGAEAARRYPLPSSELEVMRLLARRPGLRVNDVARELGMQSSNVSTAIRSLVDKGTLRKEADGTDGRVVRLAPTDAALSDRDGREEQWGTAMATALAGFAVADRAQLLAAIPLLRELADRLAATELLDRA